MSVRQFAAHLGVSDRMVSKWEAGGRAIRPRPVNQAALDTSLAMTSDDTRARYASLARVMGSGRLGAGALIALGDAFLHLVKHPLDGKLMTMIDAGAIQVNRQATWLPAYFIDVEPVTVAEYGQFHAATGHGPPASWPDPPRTGTDDLAPVPVAGLAYEDVLAYTHWADKSPPTEAQLRRAAEQETIVQWGREWSVADGCPIQYGPATGTGGGLRCTSWAADLLSLLAT